MIFATVAILFSIFLLLFAQPAHAIIVIVPTVLIPVVNIVVIIIGVLTAPIVGLTTLYFKMKSKSLVRGVVFGVIIIVVISLLAVFLLKIINPERPIY